MSILQARWSVPNVDPTSTRCLHYTCVITLPDKRSIQHIIHNMQAQLNGLPFPWTRLNKRGTVKGNREERRQGDKRIERKGKYWESMVKIWYIWDWRETERDDRDQVWERIVYGKTEREGTVMRRKHEWKTTVPKVDEITTENGKQR